MIGQDITVRPLLSALDVARVLSVHERTLWRLASKSRAGFGVFPKPLRIGEKVVRWQWKDIENYLGKLAET